MVLRAGVSAAGPLLNPRSTALEPPDSPPPTRLELDWPPRLKVKAAMLNRATPPEHRPRSHRHSLLPFVRARARSRRLGIFPEKFEIALSKLHQTHMIRRYGKDKSLLRFLAKQKDDLVTVRN